MSEKKIINHRTYNNSCSLIPKTALVEQVCLLHDPKLDSKDAIKLAIEKITGYKVEFDSGREFFEFSENQESDEPHTGEPPHDESPGTAPTQQQWKIDRDNLKMA